jgi:hypothetical protein
VYAIKASAVEKLDKDYINRNIYILSEIQAAIKALDNYQINSKLVWDCHQSLAKLAEHNRVQLTREQGCRGIEGNKTADQLAILGFEWPFIGSEPASMQHFSKDFKEGCQGLDKKGPPKILGVLKKAQTCKAFSTRTLCQKNQGTVKTKQKLVTMGDRTTYRTLSPERTPFQHGISQ